MAVGPEGTAVAVWVRYANPDYPVEASTRSAAGGWSPPVVLTAPGVSGNTPQIAADGAGNVTAIWRASKEGGQFTQAATKPRDGAWTPAVDLSPASIGSYSARLAVNPAGETAVVWKADDDEIIQAVTRSPGGPWTPPEDLSSPGKKVYEPAVDVDPSGNAVAVWYGYEGSDDAIVEAARRPAGGAWGGPDELSLAGEDASGPQVAAGPGGAVVVWERDSVIQASIGSPGPPWPAMPTTISPPSDESSSFPQIDADAAGNAVAAWTGRENPGEPMVRAAIRAAGGSFAPVQTLSPPDVESYSPRVAVNPAGPAIVIWGSNLPGYVGAQAAIGTSTGAFSPGVTVSSPARNVQYPNAAVDGGGNAVAAWTGNSMTDSRIQIAVHDATGPELRGLSVPKRGRAGKSIGFAATPFDAWTAVGPVSWSFGDKSTAATGSSVKHSFTKHGKFRVTASVTDAIGNTATASATIEVSRALAKSKKQVAVKRGKALLKLSCPGRAACSGQAKLTVAGKGKRKQKRTTTLGKSKFKVKAGKKKTVPIKLNRKGLELLEGKSKLRAKLSGNAVQARTVVLKPVRGR